MKWLTNFEVGEDLMREILFRGKRVKDGQWVYGAYYEHQPPLQCIGESEEKSNHCIAKTAFADWNMPRQVEFIEVDPVTIGQFTGLKDKNGKEIYEGDIVALNTYSSIEPINDYEGEVLIGIYGIGLLGRDGTGTENYFWIRDIEDYINHYEIFGNKFDNPEMLSGINADDISHLDHICTGEPPF